MEVAYANAWLRELFGSEAAVRQGCGASWQAMSTLLQLIGLVGDLAALSQLPGLRLQRLPNQGPRGEVLVGLAEAEMHLLAVDGAGRVLGCIEVARYAEVKHAVINQVLVGGLPIERTCIA